MTNDLVLTGQRPRVASTRQPSAPSAAGGDTLDRVAGRSDGSAYYTTDHYSSFVQVR
jgi:hypothetical protein